ncbi:trypsin-like peptidase domain-containing protein [Candidatus Gracilibacteria bacterium]|nr:trypsin-like peptidase domain-containing protein [Candidatus Gracilibacteria bacterium]
MSIVQITSSDPKNRSFGSGFVCYRRDSEAYIVTCAHVVRDVGGPAQVHAGGQAATLVAIGEAFLRDLAVLRTDLPDEQLVPLSLGRALGQPGLAIKVVGFSDYERDVRVRRDVHALLGDSSGLAGLGDAREVAAWDLRITGENRLLPGYSGAPVLNAASQVVAVASRREGNTSGLAIAIEELLLVWPEAPPDLLTHHTASQNADPAATATIVDAAQSLEDQARAIVAPDRRDALAQISRALLATVSREMPPALAPHLVSATIEQLEVLQMLAGQTLHSQNASVSFGSGNQYGDVLVQGSVVGGHQFIFNLGDAPPPEAAPAPLRRSAALVWSTSAAMIGSIAASSRSGVGCSSAGLCPGREQEICTRQLRAAAG